MGFPCLQSVSEKAREAGKLADANARCLDSFYGGQKDCRRGEDVGVEVCHLFFVDRSCVVSSGLA